MLCDALSCSEVSVLLCNDLYRLWLESGCDDLQHNFAMMADEGYDPVFLAQLFVSFLLFFLKE